MSRAKSEIFAELLDEVRRSQTATARFDRAVASKLGLNPTDMSCLDALSRAGALTAGQLATHTGLSSGAMTTAIDRLEQRGYVRRHRDTDDRRVVVIEPTDKVEEINVFYADHAALGRALCEQLTEDQMLLLIRFTRIGREFNERQAFALEQRPSAAPPGSASPRSPDQALD